MNKKFHPIFFLFKVDSQKLLKELAKIATVVCLPRYKDERQALKNIPNVWVQPKPVLTAQLIPYIDLMVGSGGTACRETTLCGIPTINFHFWDVQARYLHRKGFPIRIIRNTNKIIKASREIIQNPEKHRINTRDMLNKLESPIPVWTKYIVSCIKKEDQHEPR